MKKIILSLAALFIFTVGFADDAPFSNAPAPAQSYHSAQTPDASQSTATTATSTPSTTSSAASVPTVSTTATNTNNSAAIINSAGIDTGTQGQVTQLAQSSLAFQQIAAQHIQDLDSSNHAMAATIQTLEQNVTQLQQKITQLQASSKNTQKWGFTSQNLEGFIEFGGVAAFLLLFGVLMGRMLRRPSSMLAMDNTSSHTVGDLLADDTKSEYDFMGSRAAIPAKLDLARSYMVMNDDEQARAVLKTVLEKGDEEQRLVAEALINKIEKRAKSF